jgi:hypothetical protein
MFQTELFSTFMTYHQTKFHIPIHNSSLVITNKPNQKLNIQSYTNLLAVALKLFPSRQFTCLSSWYYYGFILKSTKVGCLLWHDVHIMFQETLSIETKISEQRLVSDDWLHRKFIHTGFNENVLQKATNLTIHCEYKWWRGKQSLVTKYMWDYLTFHRKYFTGQAE